MSRTITANYPTGLQLTASSDSPVSIVQGVTIASGAGIPLFVAAGDWYILNSGLIQANDPSASGGIGVYLQKAAAGLSHLSPTKHSTSHIPGTQFGVLISGNGFVDNKGAISGTARDGIRMATGGAVENEVGASIGGGAY